MVVGASEWVNKMPGQHAPSTTACAQNCWRMTARRGAEPGDPDPPKFSTRLAKLALGVQGTLPGWTSKQLAPKAGGEKPNVDDTTKRGEGGVGGGAGGGVGGGDGGCVRLISRNSGEDGPSPATLPEYSGPGTAVPPPALGRRRALGLYDEGLEER